ncbi:MAG: HAD hydrolase family protein [Candidatus Bathyarchaeota archaeon]|nr:HAD hydrolase family protein [Candidatus Bathyarchaeum tardum]WGM89569.1 MAG: HAD hydrolase family protein [Candidatus Bathyarchaeum tardum]WNZ30327.1 MAG: HAD hydrolase family protein [Candidatus Bathyarchaeota archaeon]
MSEASINCHRVFVTDCEGPISKNDNAFELAKHFIPDGDRFFSLISKYDDVLADVVKKPNYKAGDTLRLILPFLKAYGATNKKILDFSAKNVLLVPGAKETLNFVQSSVPSFIVSTSYEQYIASLCELTGFSFDNTYCTLLDLDKYYVPLEETMLLRQLTAEISVMPMIEIPKNAASVGDFSSLDQETIKMLDDIFWTQLREMTSGKMLSDVNPVGGTEKARSVEDIVQRLDCSLDQIMYVGDSITDAQALKLVQENGGLAVSFNGNDYSVRQADIAVLSVNTVVTSVLADAFFRKGKDEAINLVKEWSPAGLAKHCVSSELCNQMLDVFSGGFPKVELVTEESVDRLISESNVFRKTVRGEAIGQLG